MKRHTVSVEAFCALLGGAALGTAGAQQQDDEQVALAEGQQWDEQRLIDDALSAAPPQIAETATVVDSDHTVLREGSGEFTCMPTPPEARAKGRAPMCLDEEWMALMQAYANKDESYRPSRLGIAYMLAGDVGTSNINPFDTEPTADNEWIVEGPHMMVVVPDAALLSTVSTDPSEGGPYVMFPGTPFAHVMVPTGVRPEQPSEAQSSDPQ